MPHLELRRDQIEDLLDCIAYRETGPYPPYENFFKRHWYLEKALSDAIGREMKTGEPEGNMN